ncbi:MAG: RDD family protein [Balneola sp.]
MIEYSYPYLIERFKAFFLDLCFQVFLMGTFAYLFSLFENPLPQIRLFTLLSIFFLYDPIFVSFFGGTIGHYILGLRVKQNQSEHKNINFILAFGRYIAKLLLGWFSLLTVSASQKKRALHDMISGSVVINK